MTDEKKSATVADEATTEEEKDERSDEIKALDAELADVEDLLKRQQATARKKIAALKRKKLEQQHKEYVASLEKENGELRRRVTVLERELARLKPQQKPQQNAQAPANAPRIGTPVPTGN